MTFIGGVQGCMCVFPTLIYSNRARTIPALFTAISKSLDCWGFEFQFGMTCRNIHNQPIQTNTESSLYSKFEIGNSIHSGTVILGQLFGHFIGIRRSIRTRWVIYFTLVQVPRDCAKECPDHIRTYSNAMTREELTVTRLGFLAARQAVAKPSQPVGVRTVEVLVLEILPTRVGERA